MTTASAHERSARLQTLVSDAQSLLSYAAANAKEIDDDIRDALIETADALTSGTLDAKGEARFYKAYQDLTKALAPVTAETLLASQTRMPRLHELTGDPRVVLRKLSTTTAGRFIHFAVFVFVLLLTGFALGHYASGTTEIDRYAKAMQDLQKSSATRREKELAQRLAEFKVGDMKNAAAGQAQDKLRDAQIELMKSADELQAAQSEIDEDQTQLAALRESLVTWVIRPCGSFWTRLICVLPPRPDDEDISVHAQHVRPQAVFLAQLARDRMSQIVLPMLLGFLGAYTYVLRSITLDIRNRSFAPGSAIHHVVRLSLGAMAGIASSWLLSPKDVAALSSVPAWALAFVAGYSIELVFSFMDRIVTAFSSKPVT
jgi:hypothetical protein